MEKTKMNSCTIYYESWQMQCCGTPFSVGDKVEWTCVVPENPMKVQGLVLDFEEEHHLPTTHSVKGIVRKIIAEYTDHPTEKSEVDYDDSNIIREETQYADGWNFEKNENTPINRTFWGYIVELEDVTINIEKQ